MSTAKNFVSGYSSVNGLNMYYEIHGQGKPLVLIHGGGSSIDITFGRIIPLLAQNRQVIGIDMQAHGRTNDRDAELSFAQDADDAVAVMSNLGIEQADILGFSNGGQTAIEMALRYPERIGKLVIASAFYKRSAVPAPFWEGMAQATFNDMPQVFKDEFLKVNNDPGALLNMFHRDVKRMQNFEGWTDEQIQSITAPTLIIGGDMDVCSPEHLIEMHRNIANSRLAIIPGGHGKLIGEMAALDHGKWPQDYVAALIEEFLT
jgi:pimeloyl-ACP methyl ester carboxylesterase